jgi:hypothetical protein
MFISSTKPCKEGDEKTKNKKEDNFSLRQNNNKNLKINWRRYGGLWKSPHTRLIDEALKYHVVSQNIYHKTYVIRMSYKIGKLKS